jgi:GT2 family glycosyltransferase
MKDLSVIIVNYNGGERLNRCLESLSLIDDSRFSYEVIVVDNHSNKGRQTDYTRQYPAFKFISNSGNHGFANGCNVGAAKSTGSVLLFLNPGTSVTTDALFDMLEDIKVGPKCSIISYRKIQEDGSKGVAGRNYLSLFKLNGWLQMLREVFYSHTESSNLQALHYAYPDWIFGSAFMINRDGFFQMGKWDEDFWMYFEDDNLYNKDKNDYSEIVKLKNGVAGHNYRRSSKIIPKSTVIIKTEIHKAHALSVSNSNMVYESPSWF